MTKFQISSVPCRKTQASQVKVFVDGNYFIKICGTHSDGSERARDLDLRILLCGMLNSSPRLRDILNGSNRMPEVNYYDAVYSAEDALREPLIARQRKATLGFHGVLKHKCGFNVNTEGFMSGGTGGRASQKNVDSTIALEMCFASLEEEVEHLVLIGGDGDLVSGISRSLWNGTRVTVIADSQGLSPQFRKLAEAYPETMEIIELSGSQLEALCEVANRWTQAAA